ncbi:DNA-directed RNA polymerases I, II, and III subunit rpabc3 [Hondaea fermentalgiana]|uniref:DNA-directed RNA polymerases I, II, and III subunit RPABC3 n=1 Tax=Hondaea fermentalgiana TaxID=2315210 RepID=A0A2R5G8T6_9STRA|nr:DNA-directed RNA polymerases I, II, and III subunit rpabc3 [Hondaea fermentalgiana]|eukprot:GBG27476.1 DNA-directed RNA polymerases I, II, and III subunit rpabc3 [Hondaea fermentalgiana]
MADDEERSGILFEDTFEVKDVNPKGKSSTQFKNVSRIVARGATFEMDLVVDIQSELFPMAMNERFTLALASTLDMDGKPDDGTYNQSGAPTLLDKFDYGMHGRVFSYEYVGEGEHRVAIYASYGGLLMKLVGDQRKLNTIDLDTRIYCLLKRSSDSD